MPRLTDLENIRKTIFIQKNYEKGSVMFSKQTNVFNSLTIKWHHYETMQVIHRDGFGLNCMLNIFWIRAVSKPFLSIITLYPRSEVKSLDLGKLKALSKPGV